MKMEEAIAKAKQDSKQRKFPQTLDIFINFKGVDFAKPNNKISIELVLPKGRGKDKNICVICSDEMATAARAVASTVILSNDIAEIGKDKKKVKRLANENDFFIAQANLMPQIGKFFGQALGPRGKMPKPVPPGADLGPLAARLKSTVVLTTKGKNMPVLHTAIGAESMSDADLAANALAVYDAVRNALPGKESNIKSVMVKTTMGPVVRVDEVQ